MSQNQTSTSPMFEKIAQISARLESLKSPLQAPKRAAQTTESQPQVRQVA